MTVDHDRVFLTLLALGGAALFGHSTLRRRDARRAASDGGRRGGGRRNDGDRNGTGAVQGQPREVREVVRGSTHACEYEVISEFIKHFLNRRMLESGIGSDILTRLSIRKLVRDDSHDAGLRVEVVINRDNLRLSDTMSSLSQRPVVSRILYSSGSYLPSALPERIALNVHLRYERGCLHISQLVLIASQNETVNNAIKRNAIKRLIDYIMGRMGYGTMDDPIFRVSCLPVQLVEVTNLDVEREILEELNNPPPAGEWTLWIYSETEGMRASAGSGSGTEANIRMYNSNSVNPDSVRSAGVTTRFDKYDMKHMRGVIDQDLTNIKRLLQTGNYKEVRYDDAFLNRLPPDFRKHIVDGLQEACH
jgi:RNase P protein component